MRVRPSHWRRLSLPPRAGPRLPGEGAHATRTTCSGEGTPRGGPQNLSFAEELRRRGAVAPRMDEGRGQGAAPSMDWRERLQAHDGPRLRQAPPRAAPVTMLMLARLDLHYSGRTFPSPPTRLWPPGPASDRPRRQRDPHARAATETLSSRSRTPDDATPAAPKAGEAAAKNVFWPGRDKTGNGSVG